MNSYKNDLCSLPWDLMFELQNLGAEVRVLVLAGDSGADMLEEGLSKWTFVRWTIERPESWT